MGWRFFAHTFPPYVTVVCQSDVRENRIRCQRRHAIGIRCGIRAWCHAEVTCFWVDRVQTAIFTRFNPSDVVTDRCHFPAFDCWNQHRKVRLTASRWESSCDIMFFAFWRFNAKNQHMFCQPTLVAAHSGSDTQSEAFFAQQSVTTVTRTEGPDFTCFWIMHNVLRAIAWPCHVFLTCCQWRANSVYARYEVAVCTQDIKHGFTHARHDAHVDCHVRRIRQFNTDMRNRRTQWAHRERHHIHGAALHTAIKQWMQSSTHLCWCHPVISWTCIFLFFGTDISAIFDTGHVRRIGTSEIAIWALRFVQFLHGASRHHLCAQAIVLFLCTITPINIIRFGQCDHFCYPINEFLMLYVRRHIECRNALHARLIHNTNSNAISIKNRCSGTAGRA